MAKIPSLRGILKIQFEQIMPKVKLFHEMRSINFMELSGTYFNDSEEDNLKLFEILLTAYQSLLDISQNACPLSFLTYALNIHLILH